MPIADSTAIEASLPSVVTLHRGHTPLLVSLPHIGTAIPPAIEATMQPRAADREDTDWHLDHVYAFARALGASVLEPAYSRYVIDLNRPPGNAPMYPGANNTELCPTRFFTGEPLYRDGQAPTAAEVQRRVDTYWRPYHAALQGELDRLVALHGHAVLFDGHSIHSVLPWLFDGRLPDLNLGTADGRSCDAGLRQQLADVLAQGPRDATGAPRYTHVVDGRFKGGHITRHYGQPAQRVHAVQLEMCWRCYMDEAPPYRVDDGRLAEVQPLLRQLLQTLIDWRPAGG